MFILRRIGKVGNVIEEMYVCFFFFFIATVRSAQVFSSS